MSLSGYSRVLAVAVLAGFAWLSWMVRAPVQAPPVSAGLPVHLGPWEGLVLDDPSAAGLKTNQDTALMQYQLGQEPPVWLVQTESVGNRAAFHPPELCYVGNDIEVLERGPVIVLSGGQGHKVMRLLVAQNGRAYEAWYWFTAGERVTSSYYQQQLWLLRDTLHGTASSGTLVRISTPLDGGASASRRRLLAFFTAYQDRLHIPQVRLARR